MQSENLSLTQRWLRQNIQAYLNRDIVYSHVDAVLAAHPTLRPKTDIYTYDDGRSQLMLCVHGLLPITFRRASYNIPIAVWLTHDYPREPPLVYVVPTSDMLIKASKHVDISGRCDPPYNHGWRKKSEGCNLSSLVEVLADQFSREPPVYARPRAISPPLGRPDYVPTPPSQSQDPTTTAKPKSHNATRPPSQPDYATRPPPQPGKDPLSPPSLPIPPPSAAPPRPPNPEILRLHSTIHANLTQSLNHLATSLASDTTRLQAAQADLLAGEPAIRDEMARLEAVRDICRVVGAKIGETVHRAEAALDEIRRKGDPEVDELICGTTIVYNQLIDLVAEDNAIEDTIYHLHRALNAGRIDLDKFLRTTRSLAEEQFMKRALAEKVVASIPWEHGPN
ncbi:UEV-domain-containing protein [Hysterangium stoloniferum]|nr:UEV-domain-containing protein [Hysterangium stoloniferum]